MRITNLIQLGAVLALMASAVPVGAFNDRGFNPGDYEEEGGSGFCVFSGPDADVYGIGFGTGLWLKNTPVFGNYLVRMYYHGGERAYYSGIGMTLRLMPRWIYAPYIGAGGNYNYSMSRRERHTTESGHARGDSYWSGHLEAGLRIWMPTRHQFVEAAARQAWNAGPDDYVLFFIAFGHGPMPGR